RRRAGGDARPASDGRPRAGRGGSVPVVRLRLARVRLRAPAGRARGGADRRRPLAAARPAGGAGRSRALRAPRRALRQERLTPKRERAPPPWGAAPDPKMARSLEALLQADHEHAAERVTAARVVVVLGGDREGRIRIEDVLDAQGRRRVP